MLYFIERRLCASCGLCADVCPFEAISQIGVYRIDDALCQGCGLCAESCPAHAILKENKSR